MGRFTIVGSLSSVGETTTRYRSLKKLQTQFFKENLEKASEEKAYGIQIVYRGRISPRCPYGSLIKILLYSYFTIAQPYINKY